ncbi:MAG: chemotaxis response regulator protein-glutamate methylesterase [Geobacteraceae bacterium GWC2_53_11]|nr:MAG: chemotaxis response regulator protein-glutamate methylesterase [Geobacteraceae bacterium GWC2_53_11]
MKKIKVLIVDDSALVRQTLCDILNSDPEIEVVGSAADPILAAERMRTVIPDVITLDVEMPRMDGLTFLQKLMSQHPIPVVMCSSLAESGSETALKALEYGAVDIITKPKMGTKQFIEESKMRICDAVKGAAAARLGPLRAMRTMKEVSPKYTADVIMEKPNTKAMIQTTEKVVVVGASTGGTEALKVFLEMLPEDTPGIVIVQHMPENFTAAFAKRLDSICRITVKEAKDNDTVVRGRALIAPGNHHALLKRSGARYYVEIKDGPLVSRHRPSVDVLFRSAARYAGKNAVGVIMTGMGDDGAHGMKEMHDAGAFTIAQDEASCVVYGMPQEAVKLGGVNKIMPLQNIAHEVLRLCS